MMNQQTLRARYVSNSVDTMTPGRMIVALYDRLLLDLARAAQAMDTGEPATAHDCLIHAQTIVAHLHDSLDVEQWPGARNLADIYVFVLHELVDANVGKDSARVLSCAALLQPLRDAWVSASGVVPSAGGVA